MLVSVPHQEVSGYQHASQYNLRFEPKSGRSDGLIFRARQCCSRNGAENRISVQSRGIYSSLTQPYFETSIVAIISVVLPSGYTGKTGARCASAIAPESQEYTHEQSRCQPGRLARRGIRFRAFTSMNRSDGPSCMESFHGSEPVLMPEGHPDTACPTLVGLNPGKRPKKQRPPAVELRASRHSTLARFFTCFSHGTGKKSVSL
jgi:hypothetical protein